MLTNYGCDLSTSGLNMDSVHSKLNAFFEQRTNEGPRYDTYLLYYCGDVFENGDWAFSGKFVSFLSIFCVFGERELVGSALEAVIALDIFLNKAHSLHNLIRSLRPLALTLFSFLFLFFECLKN